LPARGVTRATIPGLVTVPSYGADTQWESYLDGVDTVIHLAARVHVMRETATDPLSLFREANVAATVNLSRQAAAAGIKRFVFVSSIKVNGERTDPGKPFTVDDVPDPKDPYGVSKAEAETALFAVGKETGMEITIIRPPLVYGPGVRGNFRTLMKWAASGAPSIFSRVKNKRSFVHVENLCDLLITVLDHPRAANEVFFVSDGDDLSTHELLTRLAIESGRHPRSVPVPAGIVKSIGMIGRLRGTIARLTENLQVDISSTCQLLNWQPSLPRTDAANCNFQER